MLQISAVKFISLQYGDVEEEINALPPEQSILYDPCVDPLKDLDTFAAQVAVCDLVITIGNNTVHMAGALGVPTWVILGDNPGWCWLLDREDSPWYPSVRLFRQQEQENWQEEVLNRVSTAFEDVVLSA